MSVSTWPWSGATRFHRTFQASANGFVSTGGIYPRWSVDGQELYYVRADGTLMAATIHERGDDLDIGTPVALFKTEMVGGGTNVVGRRQQYDVGSDGRFLMNVALSEVTPAPITVILNWQP